MAERGLRVVLEVGGGFSGLRAVFWIQFLENWRSQGRAA